MIPPSLVALLVLAGPAAPTCKTADQRVESLIAAHARAFHGVEYCQSRLYHTIDDLDGDGRDDFVLVFELENKDGGNNSVQYLAVFLSSRAWKPLVLKVGERGERFIDQVDVEDDRTLVLSTSEYEPGDPMCCPSGDGELRFRIDHGRLKPVEAPPDTPTTPTVAKVKATAPFPRKRYSRSLFSTVWGGASLVLH